MKKIYGNKQLLDALAGMRASGRTAHALMICGEKGSGRKLIAKYYAQSLMCEAPENGRPCGVCNACRNVEKGIHPDVIYPEKSGKLGNYKIETAREVIEINGRHGPGSHRQIIAKPVVANALAASAAGQHIDGSRAVGHRQRSERHAMHSAHDEKQHQRAGEQISGKKDEKQEETHHQHLLAWETVNKIAAERARKQGRHGVAAEHSANHVFCGVKCLLEIQRQQWHEQVKREEQQEVTRADLDEICIPQSLRLGG